MPFSVFVSSLALMAGGAMAQGRLPNIADQFQGNGTMSVPFFGKIPTTMYFDYVGQRQRLDHSMFGTTQTILEFYNEKVKYTVSGGQCQKEAMEPDAFLNPYSLPSFAKYVGNATIAGNPTEEWDFKAIVIEVQTWTEMSADGKGDKLRQFTAKIPVLGETTMVFKDIVNEIHDDNFDPAKFGCAPLVPPVRYTIAGYVTDAVTGLSIAEARVSHPGFGTVHTSSTGLYKFNENIIGDGAVYAITVDVNNNTNYFPESRNVTVQKSSIPAGSFADFALSPKLATGNYRIVISWGAVPRDLDSHLQLSAADGGCLTYYANRQCGSASGFGASLDRDKTTGFGPETITITGLSAAKGPTQHTVFIYSSDGPFRGQAVAKLYNSEGLLAVLNIDSAVGSGGRYWQTWTLMPDGQFKAINTISATPSN